MSFYIVEILFLSGAGTLLLMAVGLIESSVDMPAPNATIDFKPERSRMTQDLHVGAVLNGERLDEAA
jgi:hypothetical protein